MRVSHILNENIKPFLIRSKDILYEIFPKCFFLIGNQVSACVYRKIITTKFTSQEYDSEDNYLYIFLYIDIINNNISNKTL